MHEDGGVDAHDIVMHAGHGIPPLIPDVPLQFTAPGSVIIYGTQPVVDLARRENKTILLGMGNDGLELVGIIRNHKSAKIRNRKEWVNSRYKRIGRQTCLGSGKPDAMQWADGVIQLGPLKKSGSSEYFELQDPAMKEILRQATSSSW
jgi:hypothetical protein